MFDKDKQKIRFIRKKFSRNANDTKLNKSQSYNNHDNINSSNSTDDIEGSKPRKFKHKVKKLIDQINKSSHFENSTTILNKDCDTPYRSSIRIVQPIEAELKDRSTSILPALKTDCKPFCPIAENFFSNRSKSVNRVVDRSQLREKEQAYKLHNDKINKIKRNFILHDKSRDYILSYIRQLVNRKIAQGGTFNP